MNPANSDFGEMLRIQVMALPRYGTVDEIAAMVAYLAGLEAGFVTGASLAIDGSLPRNVLESIGGAVPLPVEACPHNPALPPYYCASIPFLRSSAFAASLFSGFSPMNFSTAGVFVNCRSRYSTT